MIELAVLADDLTGGLIIASTLEAVGVRCPVVTSVEALSELPDDVEAVVLARKIRLVEPAEARREARLAAEAFKALGAKRVFYKYSALFDSTPRGNIGPIAEELLDATGASQTIFCASFVERDVSVFEGWMFVRNVPLGESFKRFDPVTPAWHSNLVEVLKPQTIREVGLLPRRILAKGRESAEAELKRMAATPFFIVDAIDADDIARIAELTLDWPLTTGADSLPPALARAWRKARAAEGPRGPLLPGAPGFEVVLSGSCAPPTLAQLDVFGEQHPIWRVDLAKDGDDPALVDRIADWALERLPGGPVAVATSGDHAAVAAAQERFGAEGASARSDQLIGALASRLYGSGARKLIVAGGETSGQVIRALGVRCVQVAPFDDDMLGGYCHRAGREPLSLVLKPGSFGGPEFFFSALTRLRDADGADPQSRGDI